MNDPSAHIEKTTQGLMQACDELNSNCCKSVDAMMEATSAMSKGCEEFTRKWGDLVQQSVSQAMSTSKTLMGAKSMEQITKLQTEFMKEFFDSWMAGTGRLSEISARTTQQALEPVTRHANETVTRAAERTQTAIRAASISQRDF